MRDASEPFAADESPQAVAKAIERRRRAIEAPFSPTTHRGWWAAVERWHHWGKGNTRLSTQTMARQAAWPSLRTARSTGSGRAVESGDRCGTPGGVGPHSTHQRWCRARAV